MISSIAWYHFPSTIILRKLIYMRVTARFHICSKIKCKEPTKMVVIILHCFSNVTQMKFMKQFLKTFVLIISPLVIRILTTWKERKKMITSTGLKTNNQLLVDPHSTKTTFDSQFSLRYVSKSFLIKSRFSLYFW